MANAKQTITKTTLPVTHSQRGEEVVTGYVDSSHILDPNDPRAVQVPTEGLGGGNPLDVHTQPTPNEVAGDQPAEHVNPHTGEVVSGSDAEPSETSPVPDTVPAAESVDDVTTGADATTETPAEEVREETDPVVVEVEDPNAPGEPAAPAEEPAPADEEPA